MEIFDGKTFLFSVCVLLSSPLLYMVPTVIVTYALTYLVKAFRFPVKYIMCTNYTIMIISSGLSIVVLFFDYKIHSMFNFHINGFVLNLLITPGGIESMGSSRVDVIMAGLTVVGGFLIATSLFWFVNVAKNRSFVSARKEIAIIIYFLLFLSGSVVVEKTIYAYSFYESYSPVYHNSQQVPFYIPATMRHFFQYLQIPSVEKNDIRLKVKKSALRYPLRPITLSEPQRKFNIVWLVAESWRADTLTPEIMPATLAFSRKTLFFHNHYSSGNGTRMALFGMFYGLYGTYWNAVKCDHTPPVIMQLLKKMNYQFQMYTSAKFTYPEFDKTIFSNIDANDLHQSGGRGGYINDRKNVGRLLSFIQKRDRKRPFFTFMFFESPHAPYTFPKECIVKKDYLPSFNYSTVDIQANIGKIKNRYLNAVNHLDTQLARIFKFLEQEKLMENTIVIVAGDHGEEFLEKGHWGHNESFHEEQIRTPLLIYIPGIGHKDIRFLSSHLDISPTIAQRIGIKNSPSEYSLGYDLLGDKRRNYTECSSWGTLCYIDHHYKYEIVSDQINKFSTIDDREVSKAQEKFLNKEKVFEMLKNANLFYSR
jgi:membrane-anchored protein YejM (alkaline phosphatase superfamily)